MELLTKMTINPARLYQFDCGDISVGKPADVVIFDPEQLVRVEKFASKAVNSPFLGAELYGKIRYTICDGHIVYRG